MMNTSKISPVTVVTILLGMTFNAGLVRAEDTVAAKIQSDEHINVWVDDAPLNIFISNLALITGRKTSIDEELQGRVSGSFNGSVADTLSVVRDQNPAVLFDMDDHLLGAVAETESITAIMPLEGVVLDKQIEAELNDGHLPGNNIVVNDDAVVVSGHPSFVSRLSKIVISVISSATEPTLAAAEVTTAEISDQAVSVVESDVASSDVDVQVPELVIDVAAQVMLDEAQTDAEVLETSETASATGSTRREILWVTDIPGYNTF